MSTNLKDFIYPVIETERIYLKVLTQESVEEVLHHFSDENITRFMDIEPCKDLEEAAEIIQYHLDDQGCRWGIYDKTNDVFMGTCGFHYIRQTDESLIAEIGFDLSKSFWGKGYMREALFSLIEFGFNQMGLNVIDATVDQENIRSVNVMNKLGFTLEPELHDNLLYFMKRKSI